MKDKPIVSFIFIHKFDKLPGVTFSYDFVFLSSTVRIPEQQMAIGKALTDFFCFYSMSRQIAPVKSQRFQF
jgi:hypothetical protein